MQHITDLESKQVLLTKRAQEVEKLFTAAQAQQQQLAEQVHTLSAVAQVGLLAVSLCCKRFYMLCCLESM